MSDVQVRNSLPQLLVESGLMSEGDVRELLRNNRDRVTSAEDFAALLVEQDYLTPWQANKLLQGKHRGFQLGPYRLQRHLAKGGMSSLYVARHRDSDELCALKVLPPAKAEQSDASYLPRFLREAKLACRLKHPNIIRVDEVLSADEEEGGVHFMAMELLEGHDLFNKVARQGPLAVREAAEIMRQAALGLEHAHNEGLVHRDIKPGNVFVTKDARVKILDLGLAGLIEDAYQENLTREYNERVLGTADYLAPEQAVDSHRADARADIYALGCTFYFVLTGQPPFTEGTLPQRILAHQTKQPKSVTAFRRDVPEELLSLLDHMLVKKRVDRVQTAQEVSDRLQQWLNANAGAAQFDSVALVPSQDDEAAAGRPLQKIQPSRKKVTETPTDSIRSPEAQTTVSVDQIPVADSDTSILKQPAAEYSPEFAGFLRALDKAWKVDTVMDAGFREQQVQRMSVIEPVADGDFEVPAVEVTDNESPGVSRTDHPDADSTRRSLAWSAGLLATCGLVIFVASSAALPALRPLFDVLFGR
ncbi:MAG: serine/threonine protein kinase [Planctomycetaceae bacterium]|nr:serine/threonine protein kinase [Planctomycetaceae bacterium]